MYSLTGERFKNARTYQALPNHLPYQVDRFQENDVLRIFLGMFACATVQGWFFPARLPDPCKSLWDPFLYHRWSLIGKTVNRVNLSFALSAINIRQKKTKNQRCGSPTLSCSSLLSASTSPLFLDCLLGLRMMRWALGNKELGFFSR